MSDKVEDKAEDSENQNQNEDDKILKDEVKNTEVIQVEEISGNSKKKNNYFYSIRDCLNNYSNYSYFSFYLKK
jgi:hypothetical protein